MLSVKEIFYSIQGEGAQAGRPSIFIRFAGCNLWSGREIDRSTAICSFCDTDFVGTNGEGGGKYQTVQALVAKAKSYWPSKTIPPYIIFTGGEPMLQLNETIIDAFKKAGCLTAIETNGTFPVPRTIDWICVSPKGKSEIVQKSGDELKLVIPQQDHRLCDYETWDFNHFFVQPMDGETLDENTRHAIQLCKDNPQWRLSIQTHKLMGIL